MNDNAMALLVGKAISSIKSQKEKATGFWPMAISLRGDGRLFTRPISAVTVSL
jgi:hypothetical protein